MLFFGMRKGKAPGYDGITAELLQRSFDVLKDKMVILFNRLLFDGVFPTCWKFGVLKILYKGEGKNLIDVRSYRPQTLLPMLGKVLERI